MRFCGVTFSNEIGTIAHASKPYAGRVTGLEAGADDHCTKPFDAQELCRRLRAGRRILHVQDELISEREALRRGLGEDLDR